MSHNNAITKDMELLQLIPKNHGGTCHGISAMAAQAILSNDLDTFLRRANLIYRPPIKVLGIEIPYKRASLFQAIESAKKKQQNLHHKARKALQEKWQSKIKKIQTSKSFEEQLSKQDRQEYLNELSKILIKADKALSLKEQDLLSIEAFFQGVAINQRPHSYNYLFPKNENTCRQTHSVSLPITLPKSLSVSCHSSHAGVYNFWELKEYFDILREYLLSGGLKEPIAISLSGNSHTIIVGFDPLSNSFNLIDSNQLEIAARPTRATWQVASFIFNAFGYDKTLPATFSNDSVILNSSFITKTSAKNIVSDCLAAADTNQRWNQIHKITHQKTETISSRGSDWLSTAIDFGNNHQVEKLIKFGADIEKRDQSGLSHLDHAIMVGNTKAAKLLIAAGANINLANKKKKTPIYYAAYYGNNDIFKLLLDSGASFNFALKAAVKKGHYEIAKLLIEKKADINAKTHDCTALFAAASKGHNKIVKLLLDNGAKIESSTEDGISPLIIAASKGHTDTVRLLLSYKADPFKKANGDNALYFAIKNNHKATAQLLLEHEVGIDSTNKEGNSILWQMVSVGNKTAVEFLIEHKADINKASPNEITPLIIAIINNQYEIVKLLLKKGADPLKNCQDITPLVYAISNGNIEIIKLLIEKTPDLNKKDSQGLTPIEHAKGRKNLEIINLLIANGANPPPPQIKNTPPEPYFSTTLIFNYFSQIAEGFRQFVRSVRDSINHTCQRFGIFGIGGGDTAHFKDYQQPKQKACPT